VEVEPKMADYPFKGSLHKRKFAVSEKVRCGRLLLPELLLKMTGRC